MMFVILNATKNPEGDRRMEDANLVWILTPTYSYNNTETDLACKRRDHGIRKFLGSGCAAHISS